ncbi:hypothetical protein [Streptomyces sp. TRM75563]|uniref:hypothetical protein n=1 Tax=Streptomyces sp. TRM75563 TaxID=2817418 RepID=UPI001F617E64|nr:hypothetical protein [Streptomyces sp. TRM75563]MCI4039804.1 hypothetical protein [Streptomyces sp. TRM75563]
MLFAISAKGIVPRRSESVVCRMVLRRFGAEVVLRMSSAVTVHDDGIGYVQFAPPQCYCAGFPRAYLSAHDVRDGSFDAEGVL